MRLKESLLSGFIEALDQLQQRHPVVYLDESGLKSDDHRPYGYSPKETPRYNSFNWQLKNQTNAIGTLYQGQLFTVGLFDCKVNYDVFHFWIEHFLIPELPKHSVMMIDSATFHNRTNTQELLERHGHQILWLPLYNPDLNPIEKTWEWLKKKRKEWQEDCIDRLFQMFFHICMNN